MKTKNTVQLIGYLGQDPVAKTSSNGSHFVRLRMATDYMRRNEDDTQVKKVSWHSVIAWGNLAEQASTSLLKGSHIMIEGELIYRSYIAKDGCKCHAAEIRAYLLVDLDR